MIVLATVCTICEVAWRPAGLGGLKDALSGSINRQLHTRRREFEREVERHEAEACRQWPLLFAEIDKACDAYEELVAPLFDLPQLFIAV